MKMFNIYIAQILYGCNQMRFYNTLWGTSPDCLFSSLLYLTVRIWPSFCQHIKVVPFDVTWPVDVTWSAIADAWQLLMIALKCSVFRSCNLRFVFPSWCLRDSYWGSAETELLCFYCQTRWRYRQRTETK